MGNVSDSHDHTPATATLFGKHRIVEITRCLAINGHQRQVKQRDPILVPARVHPLGQPLDLSRHTFWPVHWNLEIGQHGFGRLPYAATSNQHLVNHADQTAPVFVQHPNGHGIAILASHRRVLQ